jgi:hypothetical protein
MFREHITTIRINCNRIDHDRKFRNTPSKHQSDGAQVVLEGRAEYDKAADIQGDGYVACPVSEEMSE